MTTVREVIIFGMGGVAVLCIQGLIVLVERCIYWHWTREESE